MQRSHDKGDSRQLKRRWSPARGRALRYSCPACRPSLPSPSRSSRSCCAGWLAAQRGVLPDSAIPGLNAFVLYFALPCMLFRFGMNTPMLELLNPALLLVYLLCALLMVFCGHRLHA